MPFELRALEAALQASGALETAAVYHQVPTLQGRVNRLLQLKSVPPL